MRKYILILLVSVALYQGCLCQKKNVGSAVLSGFSSDGSTNNVVGFGDDGGSGSQGNSDVLNGANNIGGTGGVSNINAGGLFPNSGLNTNSGSVLSNTFNNNNQNNAGSTSSNVQPNKGGVKLDNSDVTIENIFQTGSDFLNTESGSTSFGNNNNNNIKQTVGNSGNTQGSSNNMNKNSQNFGNSNNFNQNSQNSGSSMKFNQNSGSSVSSSNFNQNSGSNKFNQNTGSSSSSNQNTGSNKFNQNTGSNKFNQNIGSSISSSNFNQNSGSTVSTNNFNQNSGSNKFNQNTGSSSIFNQNTGSSNFNQNAGSLSNFNQISGSNNFNQNAGGANSGSYYPSNNGFNSAQPEVVKSVYFHQAPEEQQTFRPQHFVAPTPRVNYKIVFIKTDPKNAQPTVNHHYLPPPVQDEQKTLIYVLSKTPQEVHYEQQTVAPAPVIKPEVFFIKYKDEKAAQNQGHYSHGQTHDYHNSHEY